MVMNAHEVNRLLVCSKNFTSCIYSLVGLPAIFCHLLFGILS